MLFVIYVIILVLGKDTRRLLSIFAGMMFSQMFPNLKSGGHCTIVYLYAHIYCFPFLFIIQVHPARASIEGFRGTHAQASGIAKVLSASQKYMRDPEVNNVSALVT